MTEPLPILCLLFLNIFVCEWLSTKPGFRHLGTALLVIILTAIEANVGLVPTTDTPLYDAIFGYVTPFALFVLLLNVNLQDLRRAGLPMLTLFLIGSAGTIVGVVVSMWLFNGPQSVGSQFYALAGMFTGTYIGGALNFHAVALHYGVAKSGNLFVAATAADNILTAVWMVATLAIPQLMQRLRPVDRLQTASSSESLSATDLTNDAETVSPRDLALLITLGLGAMWLAQWLGTFVSSLPFVLILTTLALVLAQFRAVNRLQGARVLGLSAIYLFLAVIGAYCDVGALLRDGQLAVVLFGMICTLVLIHALIVFGIGALFRQDWDVLGIASQANIGGATSALALARSLNRPDLQLPAVLVGSLGNAIGTYLGILVAEWLR
ncbi:DUF819 family protein [Rudanella paleaurantiibacter]|uniref:DUF819 family protein n=1 Tax=Rudanella paleaurantiibacter TaxID=2614655 RepID=A0A7J5U4N6_9BACT|nr:DUF819 family protein [Rudanella paleaurantiibacter]KAB7732802.1 DUF819 family protein [Rudanella paleaurantiibacter]